MAGHELSCDITHSPQEWNTLNTSDTNAKCSEFIPSTHKGFFHNDYTLPFLEFQSFLNANPKSEKERSFQDVDLLRTSPFLSPFEETQAGCYSHPTYPASIFDSEIMKPSFQERNTLNTDLFSLVDVQSNLPDTPTSIYSFDETPSLTTYSGNMTTMLPMTSHSLLSDMNFDQGSLFVVPGHNTMDIPTPPTSPHVYSPDFPMDTSALYVTPSMWMTTATSECGSNNELYPTTVSALDPSTFYTPALFPASLMCPETRFSPKLSSHQKQSKLLALLENDESESTSMISDPFMSSCTTPSYTTLPSSTLSSSSSSTPSSSSASTLLNISSSSPSLLNYAVADPPCPMPPMLTKQSKKNNHPKGAGSNLLSNLPSFSSSFPGTVTDPVDDALPPFLTKGYPVDPPQRKDMRKKYDTEFTSSVISLSTTSSSSSSTLTSSSLNSMKLYSCARCDKSFKRKADCIRHGRIHTGEKPYKCPGCSESFARQDALRRHQGKGNVKCANALKQYITVNSIAESPEAASLVKHERLETMAKKWVYPNA
ncbi:hypothetical protein HMI54_002845 [Coelomomyces lativittatus]|nr:hypothetical protein HMI54_002845 [Coelomomyces lativittatus]